MASPPNYELYLKNDESFKNVQLSNLRQMKIAGAKNYFLLPLTAPKVSKIVFESDNFFSIGISETPNPNATIKTGSGKFVLAMDKVSSAHFMESMNLKLRDILYPQVIEKLKLYGAENTIPQLFESIISGGVNGAEKYWKQIFDEKDMLFLKLDSEALVLRDNKNGYFVSSAVKDSESIFRNFGLYRVRIAVRYIFLQDNEENPLSLNFQGDQIFFTPEHSNAPSEICMDASGFFKNFSPPPQQTLGYGTLMPPLPPLAVALPPPPPPTTPIPMEQNEDSVDIDSLLDMALQSTSSASPPKKKKLAAKKQTTILPRPAPIAGKVKQAFIQ